jgi:hypothetical protein
MGRALIREDLPRNLAGEALAAVVLAQGFSDLPKSQRRSVAVQDFMWEEAPRVGTAMATWVSWLDGLSPERRQALDDHFAESPETLDLASNFVAEKAAVADLGLDLDKRLKRASRALAHRGLRWGLEKLLRMAVREARAEGLSDDVWRGGRFRRDPANHGQDRQGRPPARRRRSNRLPPVVAWGLRLLGVGFTFLAAAWVLGIGGTPIIGVVFAYFGLIFLVVGLFVLFWGLIAIGLGLHLPPPQRGRGNSPPRRPPHTLLGRR